MQDELTPFIPFEKLRGRTLVCCFFLSAFLSGGIYFVLHRAWSENNQNLSDAVGGILFHVIFVICISPILLRSRLSYKQLFGVYPTWSMLGRYSLWTFPLIIFSTVILYLQYLTLHYFIPEFTEWWFFTDNSSIPLSTGEGFAIANVLVFIDLVLIVPIVEEFFLRGILLTRWSIKWNTAKAILVSSLIFGILHDDVIGSFFFSYVLSILYIRTKSLFIPICIHIVNNLIAYVFGVILILLDETLPDNGQFLMEGSDWILLTLGSVIIIPWTINFIRKNLPNKEWRVPYLTDAKYL